jgi:hypothetical protein
MRSHDAATETMFWKKGNGKVVLFLIKHQAMKTKGGVEICLSSTTASLLDGRE